MARRPKPWWRKERRAWFVMIHGKQRCLGQNRKEAFRRFHELMSRPDEPQLRFDSVLAICDQFLEWSEKNRSPDTYRWYKDRLQAWIETIPGDLVVSQLKPYHVQRFIDAMNVKSGTKRNYVRAVKRALSWAVEQGLIDFSPLAQMRKPRAGTRDTFVDASLHKAIIKHTADREFRDLVTFAWESGARATECFKISAEHFDAKNQRIILTVSEEKMGRAPRIIYLNDEATAIIERLVRRYPSGKLFCNTNGIPWNADAANCRFQTLTAKVGRKVCLTEYRHGFCHRLLRQGVDALTVATLMGHADPSMVAKVYSHLAHAPDYLRSMLNRGSQIEGT